MSSQDEDEDLPPCHTNGTAAEGYDALAEDNCRDCLDKFSCLSEAAKNPAVWTDRGARAWQVSDDSEVEAVLAGTMTLAAAEARISRRSQLVAAGKLIPVDLLTRKPDQPDKKESKAASFEKEDAMPKPVTAVNLSSPRPIPAKPLRLVKPVKAAKPVKVKAPKPKPVKAAKPVKAKAPKPVKAKAPKPVKAKAPKPVKAKPVKVKPPKAPTGAPARVTTQGKPLPSPRSITAEQMLAAIEKIQLGARVDLDIGHTIIRQTRDGVAHIVTLKENGFLYRDELYASLSAAAQIASRTYCRSGNDWFNIERNGQVEVRDARGKVIAKKGML